jgi:hypothetical protein
MSNMPKLIVLRTHPEHLCGVVGKHKHALNVRLDARQDDVLLIAQTGSGVVSYAMRFRCQRPDMTGETERIWGKHWNFIIEGDNWCELNQPFDPREQRVTESTCKDYGPGGPFFYVLDKDAEAFRQRGLLRPLLLPLDSN